MNEGDRILPDAQARRRIAEDFDTTLFVEAAAGTGKTTALVGRIVALIRSGRGRLDQIAAVTFTEKAAGEMKLRLRSAIESARAHPDTPAADRARLEQALAHLEVARIGTIHAFCADLLRERPVEAGVDPSFEVAPEDQAATILDEAFETWFQRSLAGPPEGVRRVLRRRPRGFGALGPRDALRNAAANLKEHRDFPAAWRRDPFERESAIDRVLERLAELGALASRAAWADDYLARNLAEVQRFVAETRQVESIRGRDYDGLEAELRELARARSWRWRGGRRAYAPELPRAEVVAERDAVKAELVALLEGCDADLAPLLREELRPVVDTYRDHKQQAGKLDFLDLLLDARDLIRDNQAVRAATQARFTHYFVDEFQDTDPLQAEILMLLVADDPREANWRDVSPRPGRLFLVGDPKQSIYRFRRADVGVYDAVKAMLLARGAALLHLTTSFRALPDLQRLVNAAFEPVMQEGERGAGQAGYVALQPFREADDTRPSVVALPVPRPYGDYRTIVNWRIDESLPDAVGAFVHWLIEESGWRVVERERPQDSVPIRARHVCILFRRLRTLWSDVTRGYVRALEARRVPHVLVGGRSFHEREEILAIRNAMNAIEWPGDDLRVFATLRGPLFALGDDALLAFRHRVGSLHPLRNLELDALADTDRDVGEALALLGSLHAERNRRPIAETIWTLLAAVRAHAGVAIWPTGEQALANCLRMIDLARRFEHRGATSFRAFVERMESEAERSETEDAPVVEEGTEGVRIMSVHRAKGLEFPVVILADPTCRATRDTPSRHIDAAAGRWAEPLAGCAPRDLLDAADEELARDAQEAVRVAYVAATRARDLLVAPVVGDQATPGWIDVLNPTLRPHPRRRRKSEPAPGCPAFGEDSVLERPDNVDVTASDSVKPGSHTPAAGEHRVVWWDPASLELDVEPQVGLRQTRILEADAEGKAADDSIRAHEQWQASRRATLERAARPAMAVSTATALAADAGAHLDIEAIELIEVSLERAARPGGKRFGSLVHAVLASIELHARRERISSVASIQGRLFGASAEEIQAAADAVAAALDHSLLRRAAQSERNGSLRRETPLTHRRPDGTLVEGIVDLAFFEDDAGRRAWTVVDFKTDREIGAALATYRRQLGLYVEAIKAATGQPAHGVLLLV